MIQAAAFLDRDGVLNRDTGYVHRYQDFVWVPGAKEAVKMLNEAGYRVIVITNQSGIGRGLYTESQFLELMEQINEELKVDGAHLDDVYFCPNHPEHGLGKYKVACRDRKPQPGLIEKAAKTWSIDLKKSFFIGDRESDRKAAEAVELTYYQFDGGDLSELVGAVIAR